MIRLQRLGRKKQPSYRFVLNEKSRDTQAPSTEILGYFNPVQNPKLLELKTDRIKHWLSVGAQCSNTVHNLLVKEGVIEGVKRRSVVLTKKRREKLKENK